MLDAISELGKTMGSRNFLAVKSLREPKISDSRPVVRNLMLHLLQTLYDKSPEVKEPLKLPIVQTSEARMKKAETREGMQVELQSPAVCTVSFSMGAEKTVLFAVLGVPQVGLSSIA